MLESFKGSESQPNGSAASEGGERLRSQSLADPGEDGQATNPFLGQIRNDGARPAGIDAHTPHTPHPDRSFVARGHDRRASTRPGTIGVCAYSRTPVAALDSIGDAAQAPTAADWVERRWERRA